MEIWLHSRNREEELRLPVLPEEFLVSTGTDVKTININAIGEIALIGKTNLRQIILQTFFPSIEYSFCQYKDFPKPYDCVALIEKWQQSQHPIRIIITGTSINFAMAITSFDYGERPGSRDIYFTLNLKEYRFLTAPVTLAALPATTSTTDEGKDEPVTSANVFKLKPRLAEKGIGQTYTVKKHGNQFSISKKFTITTS